MTRRVSKEFRVPFTGLEPGKYDFEFTLGEKFFEAFDYSEISKGNIAVLVELEKQSSMMLFHFDLSGTVQVSCDRCGDPLEQPIHFTEQLIVKFGDETRDDNPDILVLGPSEHEVDLTHYFYEYAHLALPARHVHPDIASCNQDVIAELKKHAVEESDASQWAALKNFNIEDINSEGIDPSEEE